MQASIKLRNKCNHSTNFRLPEEVDKTAEDVLDHVRNKLGITMTKNELYIYCIMIMLNMSQNEKNFFTVPNQASMKHYVDENKDEIVDEIKRRIFREQYEAFMQKGTYKQKAQKQKRIQQKIDPSE
jgi:type III secretory pathway component EscR